MRGVATRVWCAVVRGGAGRGEAKVWRDSHLSKPADAAAGKGPHRERIMAAHEHKGVQQASMLDDVDAMHAPVVRDPLRHGHQQPQPRLVLLRRQDLKHRHRTAGAADHHQLTLPVGTQARHRLVVDVP